MADELMANINSLERPQLSMKRDKLSSGRAQALNEFGFLLKDVSRLNTRHFEQYALPLGLTLGQCKVIVYLSGNEGTTQAQLAELSETDPMTLVRIIDRMEKDGLIERCSDASDRRAHRLHHFRNERYWFGVTMHLADHVLSTYPGKLDVELSPTARTLGADAA